MRQRYGLITLLVLLVGITAGMMLARPGPVSAATPTSIPGITAENYPRVNGSTSTRTLSMLLLSRGLNLPGELRRIMSIPFGSHDDGVQLVFPLQVNVAETARFHSAQPLIRHRGTHQAYMHLIARKPDARFHDDATELILVARAPSEDELKAAAEAKVVLDVRPVALDAFVFLNHVENPVTGLTLDQVREIYTGKVVNWGELGGKTDRIAAFVRDRNSGSQELMVALVMGDRKMEPLVMGDRKMHAATHLMVPTMIGVIERISETPNGIGYSVFYYEHIMAPNPMNRLLAIDGVTPTTESIAARQYPLVAEVYVVTRKDLPPDAPAAILRDWLLSDDGQRLVAESGYVPVRAPRKK